MILWSAERVFIRGKFEKDWGVLVNSDGVIEATGPYKQMVSKARSVFYYPGKVLMPSFINPHQHSIHRIFRGISDFSTSFPELLQKLIWPLSSAVDPNLFEAALRISFAEQAQAGIGTVGEFHYLHNGQLERSENFSFAEKAIEVAIDMGMRLNLIYGFFDQGSADTAKAFIQPLDTSMDEFERLRKKYASHPLVSLTPGIHSLEHTSPDAIIAAAELAKKYHTTFHVQLAERETELQSAQTQYGTSPLKALDRIGVISDRLVVVNGTLLEQEELGLIKKSGASMVICPSASLARGDDFPNTWGILKENIPFAVGGDSIAMTNNYLPTDDIKLLEFSQRSLQKTMNILRSQTENHGLLDLVTSNPADMLSMDSSQLLPGANADFMLLSIVQPCAKTYFMQDDLHFLSQLIFGWGTQVKVNHLLVQGKIVVKNGYPNNDLGTNFQRIEQWCQAFLRSMRKSADQGQQLQHEDEATAEFSTEHTNP